MQEITVTPLEALAQLAAVASLIDTAECKDEGIYNRLQSAVSVADHVLTREIAALAVAPKQEAPAGWKLVPEEPTGNMFRAAAKIDNEMFAGGSSHGAEDGQVWAAMYDAAPEAPVVAPAAANGALTDADIHRIAQENGIYDDNIRPSGEMLESFARAILAAAGPDAALIEDAKRYRYLRDRASEDMPTWPVNGSCWVVQYHHPKGTIPELKSAGFASELDRAIDAALSGAKGN